MSVVLDRPPVPPAVRRGRGSGWRPALRVGRRELLQAKARAALVVLMVLLPVTAVVTLDTLVRTADVNVRESLPAELGTAAARLDPGYGGIVRQTPDLSSSSSIAGGLRQGPTTTQLRAALPGESLLAVRQRSSRRLTPAAGRRVTASVVGVDLRDPAIRGPYRLLAGRAPARGEVAVTPELARAFPVGSTVTVDDRPLPVVGLVSGPPNYTLGRALLGLPATLGLADAPVDRYYATGPAVTWDDVLTLNGLGVAVLSRAVVLDPPPDDQVPDTGAGGTDGTVVALLVLVAVVAVLEVVLLAGPAFAVGARRQRRALALLAAGGGEPRHVRRVVLAQGLLVGVGSAVLGGPLGVALAAALRPPVTAVTDQDFGPFEVSVRDVVLVCALGGATAVVSALFPAVVASRQPVVASLRGARPAPAPPGRAALLGAVLLVVGGLACLASVRQPQAELWVGFSALPTVIGAVLLAPVLLRLVGRSAGRLPLALRFAARDADRQRSRTAPAVAAVAATVAGVVALGLSASSQARQDRDSYQPSGPAGVALVSSGADRPDYARLAATARAALPGEPVTAVRGLDLRSPADGPSTQLLVCPPGAPAAVSCGGTSYSGSYGSPVLVGTDALDALAPLLQPASLAAARAALAAGGAASSDPTLSGPTQLRLQRSDVDADGIERAVLVRRTTVTVVPLLARSGYPPAQAVLSDSAARTLGTARTVGLQVGDALTSAQERRLRDAVADEDDAASVAVERGGGARLPVRDVTRPAADRPRRRRARAGRHLRRHLVALSEARPDLATLGSLGARPRTRRAVAAGYAWVLASTGAVLGVLAGSVPGVAGAVAITRFNRGYASYGDLALRGRVRTALQFLDVPWLLLLALVVGLPLLAAALAALTTRSRLPGLGRRRAA